MIAWLRSLGRPAPRVVDISEEIGDALEYCASARRDLDALCAANGISNVESWQVERHLRAINAALESARAAVEVR